jgi:hypothetical protein
MRGRLSNESVDPVPQFQKFVAGWRVASASIKSEGFTHLAAFRSKCNHAAIFIVLKEIRAPDAKEVGMGNPG